MSGKRGAKSEKATEVGAHYSEDFMAELDGRVRTAKTLRQRLRELTNDLGGAESLSYMERSITKRAIHIERLIEKKELTLAHGGTIDEQSYYSGITVLSSLFSKLGLRRRPKVLPSLSEYLASRPAEPAEPADEATS